MRTVLLIIGILAILFLVFVVVPIVGIAWCHGPIIRRKKRK